MPHLIANYSANLTGLDPHQLLKDANIALVETELFVAHDIKSRAFKDEVFLIGLNETEEAYIHLKLYLLSGRTQEQKQAVGTALLQRLEQKSYIQSELSYPIQLCVEVIDMPKEDYFKATIKD
ncbi:5-carboxymethyl-2-hydroxymuconate Delta-isomerase [Acinetobacter sp. C26M]|uniref:5-carboxymethyl-2-hydroxymuconate Delta-isomerase n=1 Tax=unclassified Acinetobacter TaxID=196816 RepID=UPI00203745B2|nr:MULTISPECIES: 5-carboxymethyl-2-hydroxymuconate Delta-isomerase [unclassified Acinetobacter]USA47798.1 5-carboxymethyl-2-hydroxymuconate Delta-isomerase [Acinetobacter sp. C26M]USA51279.1 5-carboxymethyl-2-hydroxymuconate Delta-isomerase [Acinetobacter sp. C26G]